MFAPYCPKHRSRVLLNVDDIVDLRREEAGLLVHFRCSCGYVGRWDPTQGLS